MVGTRRRHVRTARRAVPFKIAHHQIFLAVISENTQRGGRSYELPAPPTYVTTRFFQVPNLAGSILLINPRFPFHAPAHCPARPQPNFTSCFAIWFAGRRDRRASCSSTTNNPCPTHPNNRFLTFPHGCPILPTNIIHRTATVTTVALLLAPGVPSEKFLEFL
jgi:hypothetical protein